MSIQSNFPAIKPTLLLDFANVEQLDPRITFTRASTATYYGTQTAKAEENLLLQSQTLDNASWVKSSATISADTFAAPDGTTTSETMAATGINGTVLQTFTANALPYIFSVYLLRKTGTGNVDITVDGSTFSTVTITGSWARYSVTTTPTAGSKTAGVRLATSGDEVYIWGTQLEQRSAVTAYTVTTTQTITNYVPVLLTAASGVPRFDHNPTTFESLGLLIEELRTNLVTYSEQFDNAAWTKANASITANTVVAPDGALTADTLVENTATTAHFLLQSATFVSGTSYTVTCYAKQASANRHFSFIFETNTLFGGNFPAASFDLTTGAVAYFANGTASILNVGNGWYRCSFTVTPSLSGVSSTQFRLQNQTTLTNPLASYTGNGTSGVYLWGAQLEAGGFPTSYIPTVASQVTRAADAAVMTGTNFSSWYNQAEGTFYSRFDTAPAGGTAQRRIIYASDNTANNRIDLSLGTDGISTAINVIVGGVTQASIAPTVSATNIAGAYQVNSFSAAAMGVLGTPDNSGTVPTVSQQNIGSGLGNEHLNGHVQKIAYYPLRVTNAQLQALTS
jgi:hypothetical protein